MECSMCILGGYFLGIKPPNRYLFYLINKSITQEFWDGELKEIGIMWRPGNILCWVGNLDVRITRGDSTCREFDMANN